MPTIAKNHWPVICCFTEPDLVLVLVGVAVDLAALAGEALGEQDARDRQGLLRDRGHLRQRLLCLAGDARPHLPHASLRDDHERQQHER